MPPTYDVLHKLEWRFDSSQAAWISGGSQGNGPGFITLVPLLPAIHGILVISIGGAVTLSLTARRQCYTELALARTDRHNRRFLALLPGDHWRGRAEWVPKLLGPPPERRRLRKSLRCVDSDHAALTGGRPGCSSQSIMDALLPCEG